MTVDQIRKRQNDGYVWVICDEGATLYRHGKKIITRKISPEIRRLALLLSIDAFLFGIFGPNGKDRIQYRILNDILWRD